MGQKTCDFLGVRMVILAGLILFFWISYPSIRNTKQQPTKHQVFAVGGFLVLKTINSWPISKCLFFAKKNELQDGAPPSYKLVYKPVNDTFIYHKP